MERENNWLFTKEEIENSPSRNFMSLSKENDTRRIACKFIQHVARAPRINLSRSAITTAQMLLHRYYMRKSFNDNNPWDVSIGAIFLASKLVSEYSSRISRYLIHECARVAKKINDPKYELNPKEKEFGYWKNNMNYYEMEILRIVCYDLTFEEPYSYCASYCDKINVSKEIKAVSCYLIDESFIRTTLCLQYHAKAIAAGALLLSIFQDKPSEALKQETLKLFKGSGIEICDVKAIANELKSMILKMDESASPAHTNEIKHNTHVSSNNGYSKVYSPPARTYIKSPLSQEVADNFKQPNSISSSNNVYSSPMASPVSNKELSIGDHTNMNENLYNSSSNDYISNGYNRNQKYNKGYMSYKFQGRPTKDKFRPKKMDKLRQRNLYYNNSRITKYHISPTYSKINSTSNTSSNHLYL